MYIKIYYTGKVKENIINNLIYFLKFWNMIRDIYNMLFKNFIYVVNLVIKMK
jgi:hypothetical protein